MIFQELARYKTSHYQWTQPQQQQQQRQQHQITYTHRPMSKGEFALFVSNLPFKKGDFITLAKYDPPYKDDHIYFVEDIDEVHHFVTDWGTKDTGPRIVHVRDATNLTRSGWKATTAIWKKVEYDQLPERNRAYADSRAN